MSRALFLIPALPLFASLLLGILGRKLSDRLVAWLGAGSVALSAAVTIVLSFELGHAPGRFLFQKLWTWMAVGSFKPEIAFRLDPLSLVMALVVTGVAFLIHLYSIEFMRGEEGYSRFFAYMNLFVASMLTLVLADDLLLLYLCWEGVGLCSYLLIGFWYRDPVNGRAARKAFIVTRIGDTAMAIGLFTLFLNLGTLEIQSLLGRANAAWQPGSGIAIAAAALLLGGAVGKSAQLPLQTWLPDAMAGPTPVSALIHAATMVTAGVYLIARMFPLYVLAPPVLLAVGIIGALTLLISAFSALAQTDIKRVLAYSTMSQIGYMFLALGVGAWPAAIFHFMTHAFFKALLFLSAGAVILALHHEHDIFKMGGLRKKMPVVFWCFLIGAASLSALPLVTSGFYSKDLILSEAWASPFGSRWLWAAGLLGAFLTSLYSFRLIFVVFFGETRTPPENSPGTLIVLPLVVLSVFAIFSGWIPVPGFLEPVRIFRENSAWLPVVASLVSLAGIGLAYLLYARPSPLLRQIEKLKAPRIHLLSGFGFDRLYDAILVRPFVALALANRDDFIDLLFDAVGFVSFMFHGLLSRTESGRVRWYAAVIGAGAAVLIVLVETL